MGSIAKIISTKIADYVIHVLRSRLGANIEPALFSPAGIDAPGLPDDKAFIVQKDGSGKYVCLGTLNVSQGAKAGELILFSRNSDGAVQTKIYLNASAEAVFNDGTDYAVAFTDLSAAITAFNTSIGTANAAQDTLINTELGKIAVILNSLAGPGSYTPVTIVTPPTVVDISGSQVPKVRLP